MVNIFYKLFCLSYFIIVRRIKDWKMINDIGMLHISVYNLPHIYTFIVNKISLFGFLNYLWLLRCCSCLLLVNLLFFFKHWIHFSQLGKSKSKRKVFRKRHCHFLFNVKNNTTIKDLRHTLWIDDFPSQGVKYLSYILKKYHI